MNDVDSRLQALHARYRASLPGKYASLDLAWHSLCADAADPERFDVLRRLVHRLAGSASSYGLADVGLAAAEANALLDELRNDADGSLQAAPAAGRFERARMPIERLLHILEHEIQVDAGS